MAEAPLDLPRIDFSPGDDIASLIAEHARENPGRVAVVEGERRLSWRDFDRDVERVAQRLEARSITKGSRVAILGHNSIEYAVTFFGALRAGASVVPLATMAAADALARMVADSKPSAFFASESFRTVAEALADPSMLRVGFDFSGEGFEHFAACLVGGASEGGSGGHGASTPAGARPRAAVAALDEFDVIYSSGTTGIPKGIVHSHGARKASYSGSRARHFPPDAVNVISTPFYSNTTCVTFLLTAATGGTNVILPKFSADAFLGAVERHRATHAMLVPVQYDRLFASPNFSRERCASMRFLFSTSAPLREGVKRRILDEFSNAELVEIYGLTEGGPVCSLEARKFQDKLGSVGRAASGTELRIIDDAGHDVPIGSTGEVVGRSTNMMNGYLNRPDATDEMLWRDERGILYFKTGDIARFDEDGFLYLLDRKKDVIISGGFNVYAADLETVLAKHPDVAEVAVIGVPSERWGETPLAFVVARPNTKPSADALRAYVNERVGKAERVSEVCFVTDLPKNALGKVLKRELRVAHAPRKPEAPGLS